jgi:DNA-binding response OmpR family regulator
MATPTSRLDLRKASILLLEPNVQNMAVVTQVLLGFGARTFHRCETSEQAKAMVQETAVDLMIIEGQTAEGEPDGFDFVHWLRRSELEPAAYTPVIITCAHTSKRNVARARDCGAHFIVAKPLAPVILFERIIWVARVNRPFVNAGVYVGPDRRFKNLGPPAGTEGRRGTDAKGDVGSAQEPDMSQTEIDDMMQPAKVAL